MSSGEDMLSRVPGVLQRQPRTMTGLFVNSEKTVHYTPRNFSPSVAALRAGLTRLVCFLSQKSSVSVVFVMSTLLSFNGYITFHGWLASVLPLPSAIPFFSAGDGTQDFTPARLGKLLQHSAPVLFLAL